MRQLTLAFPAAERYSSETFTVSPSNAEAFAYVECWPEWPVYGLVLTGQEASGKTHLAQIWVERSGAAIVLPKQVAHLSEQPEITTHILLENADKVTDETAFFHLINRVKEARRNILLTSRLPVVSWPHTLPDLTSRLKALSCATLHPPDDDLLAAVLRKYFADRQLTLGDEVVAYLLPRRERSLAAAYALAGRLDETALANKKPLTVVLAKQVMEVPHPDVL